MSYLALYRKYRSQSFAEIVEQEAVVKTLQNAIKFNRTAQAYILAGPRGTGKTSIARIFSKTINCLKLSLDNPEPCNSCSNCLAITAGNHLDVIEIDAASNTGVDNIRDLLEKVNFLPSLASKKIYIIDETHMLSNHAFNALLKTIEEPPAHIIFLLATTAPHKIPATIQSRCQRLDLSKVSQEGITNQLKYISQEEHIQISDEALMLIAKYSGGHLRDALSILDQLHSFNSKKIEVEEVISSVGTVNNDKIFQIIEFLNANKIADYFSYLDELFFKGLDPVVFLNDFIEILRNMLLTKLNLNKMILVTQNDLKKIQTLAAAFQIKEINFFIQQIANSVAEIKRIEDSRVFIEVLLLDIIYKIKNPLKNPVITSQPKIASTQPITEKNIHKNFSSPQPSQDIDKEKISPNKETKIRPEISSNDKVCIIHRWPEVFALIKKAGKQRLAAILKETKPISYQDDTITLGIEEKYKFHHTMLNESTNFTVILKSTQEIFGKKTKLEIIMLTNEALPTDLAKDEFQNNPLLERSELPEKLQNLHDDFEIDSVELI